MKKIYNTPIVITEIVFDVSAGDISLFGKCWGLNSPNADGSYTHSDGGHCKD